MLLPRHLLQRGATLSALSVRKDVSLLPCSVISDTDFLENTPACGTDAITVS
jgi:hypothetical protein